MADKEAQLRLRLTATNEANPAFEAAVNVMRDLNGPAESASQAISSAANEIRAFQDTLKSMSSEISSAGRSFESLNQASSGMSDKIKADEAIIGEMSDKLTSLERALNTTADSMRSVESAATGFNKAENGINSLNDTVNKGGLMLGLQQLGQSMEHIGEVGAHMFEDAIKSAAEFEYNMSRIHAVLMNREPTANMKEMSDTALKLGSNSKFSANEIAQGMYDLARQGLSSTQILGDGLNGAIEVVNNLAQSTDTDMSETAKVIADVMHEFGMSGDQLSKVGDMISGAMHTSSISMTDFYYTMRQVGPVASNMHQSIDDVSTAIALLAQHGIPGAKAGTALTNMLLGLEPRTKKAAELMHDLGISAKDGAADSFYQLNGNLKPLPEIIEILNQKFGGLNDHQKQAALAATFTKYGLSGLNTVVMEGKDKFEELKKTLLDEKSADIAHEKMNNLQGDMLRLNAAVETAKKSFGDTLAPAMRQVAQAAQGIVNWFTALDPETKKVIMVVGGVSSAMFLVGGAIMSAVSAIGFLSMGFEGGIAVIGSLLGPIGLVIAAIAALGFGAYELIKHWDQVKAALKPLGDMFSEVWGGIKQVTQEVWDYIGPTIHDGLKAISDFWNEVWPQIKQVFEEVWTVIKDAITPFLEFLKFQIDIYLGFIKGAWQDAWNAIKDSFKLVWDLIADILHTGWDYITGLFKIALDLLTGNWGKAWQDMKDLLSNTFGDVMKLFGDFQNNALQFGKDLVMSIAHGIEGAIDVVISAAQKVVSAITSIFSSAPRAPAVSPPPMMSSSGDAMSSMSDNIPAFADGGVVRKPTLAMVGEGGEEEYIIPKSKLTSQDGYTLGLSGMAFGGGVNRSGSTVINGGINITVSGIGKDGKQIGNDIMSILRREFKFSI